MTYHSPLPWTHCFFNAIPVLNPALPGARMALSPRASWIAASTAKASKGHSQWCTALGGLQNTKEARALSRLWWPTRWHLNMAPSMATWQLCSYDPPSMSSNCKTWGVAQLSWPTSTIRTTASSCATCIKDGMERWIEECSYLVNCCLNAWSDTQV